MIIHYYVVFIVFIANTSTISGLNAISLTKRWGLGSMVGSLLNKAGSKWSKCYNPFNVRIVKSAVLNFAPWLELHHVVFITPNTQSKGLFAIDFTPVNQEDISTVIKLIKGQTVPAEIRIKYIQGSNIKDNEEKIKKEWSCMQLFLPNGNSDGNSDSNQVKTTNVDAKPNIYEDPLIVSDFNNHEELALMHKTIERIYRRWNTRMNFYTHNCIHFSYFVRDMLKEDEVCPV